MPVFDFECKKCGNKTEQIVSCGEVDAHIKSGEDWIFPCEKCGPEVPHSKIISGFGFRYDHTVLDEIVEG